MSLIRLQKYSHYTAAGLLVWFVFCVSVLCSPLSSMIGSEEIDSSPAQTMVEAHSHQQVSMQAMEHDSHQTSEHACCGTQVDSHEMTKLVSSQPQLAAQLISFAFLAILFFWPVLARVQPFNFCRRFTEPLRFGYPPLFLTIQRLLN